MRDFIFSAAATWTSRKVASISATALLMLGGALAAGAAYAQLPPSQHYNQVEYVSGGIGIDESTAFSEVYVDAQNSIARAAMLADQSVARGCRLATIWDRIRIQSPILAVVLSSGARSSIRQRIRSSASQSARNLPHINPA